MRTYLLYLHSSCHDHPDYSSLYADTRLCTYTFEHLAYPPPSRTSCPPINQPTAFSPYVRRQDLRRRATGRTARAVSCSPRQGHCYITDDDFPATQRQKTSSKSPLKKRTRNPFTQPTTERPPKRNWQSSKRLTRRPSAVLMAKRLRIE